MLAPPMARVAARAERPRSNRITWAPMKRRNCRASNESSTDLPEPVGPTTRVWPTSPTCRSSRNGVLPRVSAIISGGASRCRLASGPAHTADTGIMWARFSVCTMGWRTLA